MQVSKLTAESARDLYNEVRKNEMLKCVDYCKPVEQNRCDLAGWQAVLDAVKKEVDQEWAWGMLNAGVLRK